METMVGTRKQKMNVGAISTTGRTIQGKLHGKAAHMEGKPQFNSKGKSQAKTYKGFHFKSANQQASGSSTSAAVAENSSFSKE